MCRKIEIHHKLKLRLKSFQRRKKDERLLLDMPTTDPGSDLLFSTDDEYIDTNGVVTYYGTIPPRIRRHLLKSELQRRYMEEIADDLKNMPPELIITSPSNKHKQKRNTIRLLYRPSDDGKYERKSQTTNELPFIEQPAKRTRSWHNLNTVPETISLTSSKPGATKNKSQSPFYRPVSKKEILSKEDLEIKLSLKKKIWAGIQHDDISMGIDRTRPLSWIAPHSLKTKKMTAGLGNDVTLAKLAGGTNIKKLENEAFLTACSRKLMEWQIMCGNPNKTSPCSQKSKVPIKLVEPDNNDSIYILKHLSSIKMPSAQHFPEDTCNDISIDMKPKRTTISKVVESTKIFTKLSKSKSRNSITTAYRSTGKQTLLVNQHKANVRNNKFKTGGLVVTAVQTGNNIVTGGNKKNKKFKSLHFKLPNVNSCNTNNPECAEPRRPPTISNNNKKCSMATAASTTTSVRKVKTKLKKKKNIFEL